MFVTVLVTLELLYYQDIIRHFYCIIKSCMLNPFANLKSHHFRVISTDKLERLCMRLGSRPPLAFLRESQNFASPYDTFFVVHL